MSENQIEVNNQLRNLSKNINDLTVQNIASQNELRTDQQKNDSKFEDLSEKQVEVSNQLRDLSKNMNDLTVQNIASQNELRTIQEGIVSNTVKITSDSDLSKQRVENLEKYVELPTANSI